MGLYTLLPILFFYFILLIYALISFIVFSCTDFLVDLFLFMFSNSKSILSGFLLKIFPYFMYYYFTSLILTILLYFPEVYILLYLFICLVNFQFLSITSGYQRTFRSILFDTYLDNFQSLCYILFNFDLSDYFLLSKRTFNLWPNMFWVLMRMCILAFLEETFCKFLLDHSIQHSILYSSFQTLFCRHCLMICLLMIIGKMIHQIKHHDLSVSLSHNI